MLSLRQIIKRAVNLGEIFDTLILLLRFYFANDKSLIIITNSFLFENLFYYFLTFSICIEKVAFRNTFPAVTLLNLPLSIHHTVPVATAYC